MALIDFKCDKCGDSFFEILKDDKEKVTCPNCGSESVKRIYKGKYYGKGSSCGSGGCAGCSGCGN